jgi:hypothetical protein
MFDGTRPSCPTEGLVLSIVPKRPSELSTQTSESLDANRAYCCPRGLLAGVRPGHAPRNSYAHRVSANLRAACRSHLAPRIGHRAAPHITGLGPRLRPSAHGSGEP